MTEERFPIIQIIGLEQICMVVHDLQKDMEALWHTFGIGPWNVYTMDADSLKDTVYYGKPTRFGFKVARTKNKVGGVEIELIEPLEGDNIYRDFLSDHGEGIHHLGWHTVESLEAFAETSRALEKKGFPCMMSGRTIRSAFAYFDTTSAMKTVLEVIWWDPAAVASPPPQGRIFPEG